MSLVREHRDNAGKKQDAKIKRRLFEMQEAEQIEKLAEDQKHYDLLLSSIEADCKRVSALPRGDARRALKKNELIPRYMPYIEKYLQAGEEYRNPVLVQVMIWMFDIFDIENAIQLADTAVKQKQPMPKRFKRDICGFIADAVLEWCKYQEAHGRPVEPHFSRMMEQVTEWPVHDIVKMQYLKKAGWLAYAREEYSAAYEYFLNAKKTAPYAAKVETILSKLELYKK